MGEYQFVSLEYILSSCFRQACNLQVNIFDGLEVCNSFPFFIPEDGDRASQSVYNAYFYTCNGKGPKKVYT